MSSHFDMAIDTVLFDLDGTLVDSVYQHTVSWQEAFRQMDVVVPAWRLHRAIGMGGDRLVEHVAGEDVETSMGDEVRNRHAAGFEARLAEVTALDGASELLKELRRRRLNVVLASSAPKSLSQKLLDKVEGSHLLNESVSGSEAEQSKPSPDLIEIALQRARAGGAVMVGDAVWDVEAARRAGVKCIALRCGGFSEAELSDAGANQVFEGPRDLLLHLDESLIAGSN